MCLCDNLQAAGANNMAFTLLLMSFIGSNTPNTYLNDFQRKKGLIMCRTGGAGGGAAQGKLHEKMD